MKEIRPRLTPDEYELVLNHRNLTGTEQAETTTQGYEPKQHFSAIGDNGQVMEIKTYCKHYGFDFSKVRSYKLVSHTGIPFYNIAFHETLLDESIDFEAIRKTIREGLSDFKYIKRSTPGTGNGVIKISDLHFGAFVQNTEFHPLVIKHIVDGVCHILMHGDKAVSKKSAEKISWEYGEQGMFNLICMGHLHATIEKLTVKQREQFETMKEESASLLKMHCPSFFSGNEYSEFLGFTTRKAFVICEDNGKGIPDINNLAL